MAWRQRIYAFLLRRILGPYLAPSSLRKLHHCVEVSLTEGRFVLTDVELDPDRLNALLFSVGNGGDDDGNKEAAPTSGGLRVRRAVVRRLGILLSLREGDDVDDGDGSRTESDPSEALTVGMAMNTMSKAYRLSSRTASDVGSSSRGGGVALLAHIEIDGLEIDLAPLEALGKKSSRPKRAKKRRDDEVASPSAGGGYLSSYVDAALASLRLTLSVSNASIRAFDRHGLNFVAVRLASASYRDDEPATDESTHDATLEHQSQTEEALLHKSVEFDGFSIESGIVPEGEESVGTAALPRTIMRTDGSGSIRLRAVAVRDGTARDSPSDPKPPRIQKEVDATLCEHLSFSLDATSMGCLASVMRDIGQSATARGGSDTADEEVDGPGEDEMFGAAVASTAMAPDVPPFPLAGDDFGGDAGDGGESAEAKHISEIMRQYAEARHLARTREVRGGMLLPSFSFDESGEGAGSGDGAVAFDIFFDANEQSFHHYRSMVSEAGGWHSEAQGQGSVRSGGEDNDGFVHTRVAVRLPDCNLKCSFEDDLAQKETGRRGGIGNESLITILDCALTLSLSESGSDATFSVSHFLVEDSLFDWTSGSMDEGHLLRFLDPSELYQDAEVDGSGGTYIVSSAPCLSVDVVKRRLGGPVNEGGETAITLVLDPMELIYRQQTVSGWGKVLQCFAADSDGVAEAAASGATDSSMAEDGAAASPSLRLKANCPALTILCPIAPPSFEANNESFGSRFDPLFERIGYRTACSDATPLKTPVLGLSFDEVSLELSTQTVSKADDGDNLDAPALPLDATASPVVFDEMIVEVTCQNAIMFANKSGCDGSDAFTTRADVVSFQGETRIDSTALVKVQYKSVRPKWGMDRKNGTRKLNQNNNSFPLVPPLSAVKATQPHEDTKMDDMCSPGKGAHGAGPRRHRGKRQHQHVRASDPQYAMSAEAAESNRNLDVSMPSVAFDMTTKERAALLDMISALQASSVDGGDSTYAESGPTTPDKKQDPLGLSLSCKRVFATLHGSEEDFVGSPEATDVLGGGSTYVSYVLIADGLRLHILMGSAGGVRNLRICSHDLTLYEVIDLLPGVPESSVGGHQQRRGSVCRRGSSLGSADERCCEVRRRGARNESTREARPILFRQKLYRPLSPETSAFILDVLNRSWGVEEDADDEVVGGSGDVERSIYFSLYDVTHRCDINSHWRQRFATLVRGGAADNDKQSGDDSQQLSHASLDQEERSLLTNLFVTLSDCTLDYASPRHFMTPSRSLLRFGEIRLTSNILSPPAGPTQMYKLSVADFEHHLCNHRVSCDAENSRLSCSGSILRREADTGKSVGVSLAASIEDSARRMGFVTVATLDSADVLIAVVHEVGASSGTSMPSKGGAPLNRKPDTTVTLSLGRACLYTCRDSFACFADTFGEWVTELTTPSEEDVARLKTIAAPVEDDDDDLLGKSIFPDSNEAANDTEKTDEYHSISVSSATDKDLTDIPDSELSAAELRKKHGLAQNGMSEGLSSSLFSKEFGALSASCGEMRKCDDEYRTGLSPRKPSRRSAHEASDAECQLGGHGWTTVDHEWSHRSEIPPGQEQSAKWLTDGDSPHGILQSSGASHHKRVRGGGRQRVQIVQQHIPKDPGVLFGTGTSAANDLSPDVKLRVVVRDLSANFRFFDGYDWKDSPTSAHEHAEADIKAMKERMNEELVQDERPDKLSMLQRRAELIGELLDGCEYQDAMFGDVIQADDASKPTKPSPGTEQRKARQTGSFFSVSATGVRLQYDSFLDATDHRLSSRLDLSMADLFIAETISDERKPVKLLGEWFNEKEHPRDSNDGLLMMKMVSMHPVKRISDDGKYFNDESRVTLQLLPLRFFLHQKAIRLIKRFFTRDEADADGTETNAAEQKCSVEVTPTFFQRFKVFPTKLKVDYQPEQCDTAALKDGSYVELINLLPLEDMVLTLQPIELMNILGWGSVLSEITTCWLRDICATQMHKFITNTSPFHPILNVGGGVAEMFLIPIEEMKDGGSLLRGLRDGTAAFAGTVAYEALNTTSKVSKYAANALSGATSAAKAGAKTPVVTLPVRPSETPSKFGQVARHAVDSLSRGLEEANYKIIIVPCREYCRSGTTGAVKSVIRGIPVAVRAPLSGASEAVSYATLLARNAVNPEKRKEEEATFKGLSSD